MTDLRMYRGDDRDFTVTLTEDGSPMDLTGADVRFTAKEHLRDDDEDAVVVATVGDGIVVDDPTSGVLVVSVDAEDTDGLGTVTRFLRYDVQVTRGGSTRTVVAGRLYIDADVSRTTP